MITAPVPAQQPRPSRAPLYVATGVGVVIGAVVVGLLWLTIGGSGGIGGSTTAVAAPDKLGAYQRFDRIQLNTSGNGKVVADRFTAWNKQTAQRLSDAYGGAAATVQSYASDDLQVIFTVQVVRADAPGYYVPYEDPKTLALKAPQREVRTYGEVECAVNNQQTPETSDQPVQVLGVECQRTGGGLTVHIPAVGGDLGEHPEQVAALVDQAFTAIG